MLVLTLAVSLDLHTLAQDGNISQVQAEFSRIPKFQATYSDIPSGAQSKNRCEDFFFSFVTLV